MIMPIDDGSETTNDKHVIAIGQCQQQWRWLWWSNSPSRGGFSQDTWKSRLLLSPGSLKSGHKEPGFHRKNNCQLKDIIIGIYHLDAGASVSFKLPVMERAPNAIPTHLKKSLHPFFRFFFFNLWNLLHFSNMILFTITNCHLPFQQWIVNEMSSKIPMILFHTCNRS